VRPVLARSIRPARASTSRCLITAGSDTSNRPAICVTASSLSCASRSRIARRVGSASAANARSSRASLRSTIWLSIIRRNAAVKDGTLHNRVPEGIGDGRARCLTLATITLGLELDQLGNELAKWLRSCAADWSSRLGSASSSGPVHARPSANALSACCTGSLAAITDRRPAEADASAADLPPAAPAAAPHEAAFTICLSLRVGSAARNDHPLIRP
jgi:hypothetical protein